MAGSSGPSDLAPSSATGCTSARSSGALTYLATVIDLASRRGRGLALADQMRAELLCHALRMAITHRRRAQLIFESDFGKGASPDGPAAMAG